MLPEPALTFTIPSLRDGTVLDCRVYHPASLTSTKVSTRSWQRHAAVLAHPYAPLGGSYDDSILESVAARLLRAQFLVGTFNFRWAKLLRAKTPKEQDSRYHSTDWLSFAAVRDIRQVGLRGKPEQKSTISRA